jgi:SAM-dependent methyltransferase
MLPVLDVIDSLAPGRALDLACGRGRYAHALAERGWDVMAVDWSDEALAEVRTPKMKLDLESGAPLPFADASFDLVLIVRFLHRPLFDEAERVLKPGGVLITWPKTTGRFGIGPRELEERFHEWETIARWNASGLAVRRPRYP